MGPVNTACMHINILCFGIQGYGSLFYFREDRSKKLYAIYTLLDDHKTEAYLQPASDEEYKLTAIVGSPKYIFKLPRIKKSIQSHAAIPAFLHSSNIHYYQGFTLLVLCTLFLFVCIGQMAT